MGTRRYQLTLGQAVQQVAESTPSTIAADTVRVDIDFTAKMTRGDAIAAIDAVRERILEGNWPPAAP